MSLQDAIERLYDVFSKYPVQRIEGCECCTSQDELDAMFATPVRELLAADLGRYVWVLGRFDIRAYLPRLIELNVLDDAALGEQLSQARWLYWPVEQIDAVKAYRFEKVLCTLEADERVSLSELTHLLNDFESACPRLEMIITQSLLIPKWYAPLVAELMRTNLHFSQQIALDWLLENVKPRSQLLLPARF